MANVYTVIKQFDDAIIAAGYSLNNADIENTQHITDGVELWSFIIDNGITLLDDYQLGEHVVYEIDYRIKCVRGSSDNVARNSAISDDFDAVMKAIYEEIGNSDAEILEFVSGDMSFLTEEKYQSFFSQDYRITYKHKVC